MAKYDPSNLRHRGWLASNILDLLQKWGFIISFEQTDDTWEFVCEREDKFNPSKKIIVFTSIDKRAACVRAVGTDRIRFVVKSGHMTNGEPRYIRVARVNRVGEFREINKRICDAIIKAQKAA